MGGARGDELCGTANAIRVMESHPTGRSRPIGVCRTGGPWFERLWESTPSIRADPFVYVNVGANKGFNIAQTLQMLAGARYSNQDWHAQLLHYVRTTHKGANERYSCGVCGLCKLARRDTRTLATLNVSVHAIEQLHQQA